MVCEFLTVQEFVLYKRILTVVQSPNSSIQTVQTIHLHLSAVFAGHTAPGTHCTVVLYVCAGVHYSLAQYCRSACILHGLGTTRYFFNYSLMTYLELQKPIKRTLILYDYSRHEV